MKVIFGYIVSSKLTMDYMRPCLIRNKKIGKAVLSKQQLHLWN